MPTQEEKIDYIYETLKKQESRLMRATIFKWGFRLFILGYMYYFITVGLPSMMSSMVPNMPDLSSMSGSLNTESLKNTFSNFLK